ncbi:hypothetical protein ACFORL_10035 [Legionella dresdenensis]|uniref:Uncharacterized protein n=1 Tax=Legionella dresdenensis TaxID=450200 RepID=A0ABV8CHF0_9GAMM
MINSEPEIGGLELNFFPSAEFETAEETPDEQVRVVRNVLRLLMMGWQPGKWKELISWPIFKDLFINRDPHLTREMRLAFQEGFNNIYQQLSVAELNPAQLAQAQIYISNCMAYLPFAELTTYESMTIPQWINNQWRMVDYKVKPMELTLTSGLKKLFIEEEDRVFCYGLEPINFNLTTAKPHLIFMGTNPVGRGFNAQLKTDFEDFETTGKDLYRSGRSNIVNWLDRINQKIDVCGVSLGGSQSVIAAIDQGDRISRVNALNPTGLYIPWRKSRYDNWATIQQKPEVHIQRQGKDPVSQFGHWREGWNVWQVDAPEEKCGTSALIHHTINFAGLAGVTFRRIDPAQDNQRRRVRDYILNVLLRSLVSYLLLIPYHYLILPLIRFLANRKLQVLISGVLFGIFFAAIGPAFPLGLIFFSAISVGYLLTRLIETVSDKNFLAPDSQLAKYLYWFAERSLFTQFAIGIFTVSLVAGLTSAIFLPTFASSMIALIILGMVSVPMIIGIAQKMVEIVKVIIGVTKPAVPPCEDINLPLNESLNIYRQKINVQFSHDEINAYRQAKDIIKKKPKEETPHAAASAEMVESETVTVHKSRAKIVTMREMIRSINRFGINASNNGQDQLERELEQVYQKYSAEKQHFSV